MKKFLLTFLFAFAILIPSVQVSAADVPDFYQVGSQYLTFTGRENTSKGYRVYGYDCSIDLKEDFAERYMRALINNYGFKLVGHYVNDYRRGQAKLYEHWIFVYTGSKRVSTFERKNIQDRKNPYYCHLAVGRAKDWNRGVTHFSILVVNGLTYARN